MSQVNPYGSKKMDLRNEVVPATFKNFVAKDILKSIHSGVYWDRRYNLKINTSSKWAQIYKKRGVILDHGRPSILTEEQTI